MTDETNTAAVNTGYESILTNPALGTLRGLFPPAELRALGQSLLRQPAPLVRHGAELAARLAHIAIGVDDKPGQADRRFADRAWSENPALRRVAQSYLATSSALNGVLQDAELDRRTTERLQLTLENLLAAASPTNSALTNPAAWKEAIDTGGRNFVNGYRQFLVDVQSPAKLPASVDQSAYRVGENLATTPGKVVRRTRLYELIQYQPTLEHIDATPVLMIPSPVNKFYLLDLEPDQSVLRAQLAAGRNLFAVSWVNPDESHADIGMDDYIAAIIEMLETVAEISGSPSSHLFGLCGGGLIVFVAAAYLAAVGRQDLLASLTVGIAVLDYGRGPQMMAFLDRKAVDTAIAKATRRGYFDARQQARAFAMIRPIEGIWDAAVQNYLLGKPLPRMGLLFWASDQTNMATKYGGQVMELSLGNSLVRPGALTVMGTPIDARQITVDTYVLGASTDHISPWDDCYRTVSMIGGSPTFVLARGGHAIVIARPPGHTRSTYRTGEVTGDDPLEWLARSEDNKGSWWEHWNEWIQKRTPDTRPAPESLGSAAHPVLGDAPGAYVRKRLT